jgi:hypothetical protein
MLNKDDEAMRVFVRVRPPISKEIDYAMAAQVHPNKRSISIKSERGTSTCAYDRVFDEVTSQADVFENIKPLLGSVLSGYNACLFAYGQTSAGKSYTMIGPNGGQDILKQNPVSFLCLIYLR